VWEQSYNIPQVPDTFTVRINLFADKHFSSYDIYPFYLLSEPLSTDNIKRRDDLEIMISPNPANNKSNLVILSKINTSVVIKLYNQLGQVISRIEKENIDIGENQIVIELEELSKGQYFIDIEYKKGKRSLRLLKQ